MCDLTVDIIRWLYVNTYYDDLGDIIVTTRTTYQPTSQFTRQVETLILERNEIEYVSVSGLKRLKHLFIDNNKLQRLFVTSC